ncbi:MAG TPA: ATPase [Spirochaeta sp.]|nr:ATPase [Spirochaeta sp.]
MRRKISDDLMKWKGSKEPYMLTGARQVGKTYILDTFCKSNFDHYIYLNLEKDSEISAIFDETINPEEIVKTIGLLKDISINPEDTVIFFDEIQVSEKAVTSLKYFCDSEVKYNIVCAGSLLGVALNRFQSSFPVGKVRIKNLHPMNFEEFMFALNLDELRDQIVSCFHNNRNMTTAIHEKLLSLYKDYLFVGGMPASILEYLRKDADLQQYDRTVKRNILDCYVADMSKYTTTVENNKIKQVFLSIPKQLGREKSKFNYNIVSEKAKGRSYKSSIEWLVSSGLVDICRLITTPRIPLKVYEEENLFKLYLNDVGLLCEQADMSPLDVLGKNIDIFKGMLTENFVSQTFTANNISLNYWSSSNSAEVDFIVNIEGSLIPVEVKAAENTKAKSLSVYREKYNPDFVVKLSAMNFGFSNGIKTVPLYAAWLINYV